MIVFSFAYVLACIIVICIIGYLTKAKWQNLAIAIPISIIGIPIVLLGILFVFKGPIQKGVILQNTSLGPILNLIAPAPDLYQPLASTDLKANKKEYTFVFANKYLGNHALMVSSPKPITEENPRYDDIAVTFSVFDGKKELFKMGPRQPGLFFGRDDYGAFLASYKVPRDLPVSKQLTATVTVSGDLKGFLDRRGSAVLKIRKYSDE